MAMASTLMANPFLVFGRSPCFVTSLIMGGGVQSLGLGSMPQYMEGWWLADLARASCLRAGGVQRIWGGRFIGFRLGIWRWDSCADGGCMLGNGEGDHKHGDMSGVVRGRTGDDRFAGEVSRPGGGICCGSGVWVSDGGELEQGGVPLAFFAWAIWALFWLMGWDWEDWALRFGSWASFIRGLEDGMSSSNPNIV